MHMLKSFSSERGDVTESSSSEASSPGTLIERTTKKMMNTPAHQTKVLNILRTWHIEGSVSDSSDDDSDYVECNSDGEPLFVVVD